MKFYDPIQAILCIYYNTNLPYFEPLRALPLPKPDVLRIIKSDRYIRCNETRSRCTDRAEYDMARALDAAARLPHCCMAARKIIEGLDPEDRSVVEILLATSEEMQFDFARAAEALTTKQRDVKPPFANKGAARLRYKAWCEAKGRNKRQIERMWHVMRFYFLPLQEYAEIA